MSAGIALVTGGSRGIGRAIACELARQTWHVVTTGRDSAALEVTRASIVSAGGTCDTMICDLREPASIDRCVEDIKHRHGRIDALVNNAGGGSPGRPYAADEVPDADWIDTIDMNLTSVYRFCRAVLPTMKTQRRGAIVNVSSIAAHVASNLSGIAYTAAKTGMVGLTRHLAKEVGPFGIRVNTIAPGIIASERVAAKFDALADAERNATLSRIPLNRIGRVEEVATVVAFLASEGASYIHGALIDINGGMFMD
jgi:3-oxoacyl-[acyl-carrier protein] reductase